MPEVWPGAQPGPLRLASLDVATLKEMTTRLDDAPKTSNTMSYLSPRMEFIDEFKALSVPNAGDLGQQRILLLPDQASLQRSSDHKLLRQ